MAKKISKVDAIVVTTFSSPYAIKAPGKQFGRIIVVIMKRNGSWRYGSACTRCNDAVIAPSRSEYMGEHRVRHSWSCENCGHQFETSVHLHTDGAPRLRRVVA
jgi:hypothetical protein